jgi:hypothetical protein
MGFDRNQVGGRLGWAGYRLSRKSTPAYVATRTRPLLVSQPPSRNFRSFHHVPSSHDDSQIRLMKVQDHGEHAAAAAAYQAKPVLNGYPAKPKCAVPPPRSLHDVCLQLKERVDAFLAEEPERPLLRNVQAQLRVSMGVVEEALGRHRCVFLLLCLFHLEYQQVADAFAHRPGKISISYNGGKDCTSGA